ncbi:NAD-glutamate dehydrogenase, partial [Terasakiella sp. A23]
MKSTAEQNKDLLIRKVADATSETLGAEASFFVKHFFAKASAQDILDESFDVLFGATTSLWRFMSKRTKDEVKVQIYNPNLEEHGWQSDHTIIQICVTDRPFLVDSIISALDDYHVNVLKNFHPVLHMVRGDRGKLVKLVQSPEEIGVTDESIIFLSITKQTSEVRLKALEDVIHNSIVEGTAAVSDWRSMREELASLSDRLLEIDHKEAGEFLHWLDCDHFTYLGLVSAKEGKLDLNSALGIFKQSNRPLAHEIVEFAEGLDKKSPISPLTVFKSSHKSLVHRPVFMDIICINHYDDDGAINGFTFLAGLFTSSAYRKSLRDVPFMKTKWRYILDKAGFTPKSHNEKSLQHVIETFPRSELFQGQPDLLFDTCYGIFQLNEREKVSLFIHPDIFGRSVSAILFVPKDVFTTRLRRKLQGILEDSFNATVLAFYTKIDDSPLAQLHVVLKTTRQDIKSVNVAEIETLLIEAARNWSDQLRDQLVTSNGEEKGLEQFRRYANAFPSGYIEGNNAAIAVSDIAKLDEVVRTGELQLSLYRPIEASENVVRFKLYHPSGAVPLSHVLPMLENMGLRVMDEHPYPIRPENADVDLIMIHDFGLVTATGDGIDLSAIRESFQETFRQVWNGVVENDGFNRLVIQAGIKPWPVMLLRALCKYLRQANITFSQS